VPNVAKTVFRLYIYLHHHAGKRILSKKSRNKKHGVAMIKTKEKVGNYDTNSFLLLTLFTKAF